MKKIKNRLIAAGASMLLMLGSLVPVGCEDTLEGVYPNESTPTIYEFICDNSELTQFRSLLERADMTGLAQAYGGYTCFAPNNKAVEEYLTLTFQGKPIDSLSVEQAQYMVKYHFVADTLATSDFNESRLNAVNMVKQYIQTSTRLNADSSEVDVFVNGRAKIVNGNNRMNNGYVHIIDGFLSRPLETVAETVMGLPRDGEYSIMLGILDEIAAAENYFVVKEDGTKVPVAISSFYDSSNDTTYVSFLLEDNEVLESADITNLESLLVDLREKDLQAAYTDSELLYNWLGYHCLSGRVYLKDIMEASSLTTAVPSQVITVSMVVDSIYLNRFKTAQIDEDGIYLTRQGDFVDYACKDGVIQTIGKGSPTSGIVQIIERKAYRVYWDLGDQPEIRALAGFRKAGTSVTFYDGDLSMMRWVGKNNFGITYYVSGLPAVDGAYDVKSQYVYGDQMTMRLCSVNAISHMEITTPVLVAGKYNIWICWRRANPGKFNATFHHGSIDEVTEYEDQFMPSNVDLQEYMDDFDGDEDKAVANGWKRYNAKAYNSVFCCRKIGTVEVKTTGAHTLIFDATIQSKGDGDYWDMIQYIPLDEDQTWPRIAMNGDLIEKGTPDCQIYPNQCGVNGYPIKDDCPYHNPVVEETPAE